MLELLAAGVEDISRCLRALRGGLMLPWAFVLLLTLRGGGAMVFADNGEDCRATAASQCNKGHQDWDKGLLAEW